MTMIAELGRTIVKTAVSAAAPQVAATAPRLATEAVPLVTKALAEPVGILPKAVETTVKPVFETAIKPIGEMGKGITPSITASVLEAIPAEARLPLLERGFFSKAIMKGEIAHAPVLTPTEMKALGTAAGIDLPDDVLANPKFAETFSDALQNRLLTADKENFSLQKTVRRSLKDAVRSQEDADDLEKLKRDAAKKAVRKRMIEWRKSILSDPRFRDRPDEEKEALAKVNRYEQRLLLEVDIRFTFGSNLITETIGEVLRDPKAA